MLRNRERPAAIHSCLSRKRRRHVLYCLKNRDRPQALADLAEYVAGQESDTERRETDKEVVKNVYFSLYHCHIPKLEAGNLVEYNQEKDTVTLAEYPEEYINEQALEAE